MSEHDDAKKVISELEGTAIADLRSLVDWVSGFTNKELPPPSVGSLNFTLALVSLLACEACGFYFTGASKTSCDYPEKPTDVGTYIMQFVQKYFHQKSCFKHLDKVLADFLRHVLVHGYGVYSPKVDFDMALFINTDLCDQLRTSHDNGKRIIKLNSLALADHTISAFNKFKKQVNLGQDTGLLCKIVQARDVDVKVNKKVAHQFDTVYNSVNQQVRRDIGVERERLKNAGNDVPTTKLDRS